MSYPYPYDTYDSRKKAVTGVQLHISASEAINISMCRSITLIDRSIYSDDFRTLLISALQSIADSQILTYLQTEESTRTHLYRFFMKGSNVIPILKMYLEHVYDNKDFKQHKLTIGSDWDTTIIINPSLPSDVFSIIHEQLVKRLQILLIHISRLLSDNSTIIGEIARAVYDGINKVIYNTDYELYREHLFRFVQTDKKPRYIKLYNEPPDVNKKALSEALGPVGEGLVVSSDRNAAGLHKFYLARIMAHVITRRDIPLPVELLDVSINYQNDDLYYAWDSHSEYHVVFDSIDMRIITPTGLYADLKKCIRNANDSTNQTRKNKKPKRLARIKSILNEMIIPYGSRNEVMFANLERHLQSSGPVGNVFRNLNRTLRNTRRQQHTDDDDTNDEDTT